MSEKDHRLKEIVKQIQPVLNSSLDPVCIVNTSNQIVHLNLAMKNFLGIPAREMKKHPVFCNLVKLVACEKGCQIQEVLKTGEVLRLDEAPALKGAEKLRVLLKATPLVEGPGGPPIGAIVTLRETTGEVLLQAKYHKVMQIVSEKDAKIASLEERLNTLQAAMRRARQNAAA